MNNIQTTLFHFHDGVISENRENDEGHYIAEAGCTHLEVVSIDGVPTYSRIIEHVGDIHRVRNVDMINLVADPEVGNCWIGEVLEHTQPK